ncbi:MAG TPA: ComEC/Rec2 family competence protein [Pyrinomonadaceae bacterium]
MAQTRQGCGCAVAVLVVMLGGLGFVGYKFVLPWWRKQPPPASGKEMRVHVLDVGQGDSILIISPEGKVALIDAGDQTKGKSVVEALKRYNVQQIDYLIATHAHPDHIGGMDDVIKSTKVLNVLHNDIPPPEAATSEAAKTEGDAKKQGQKTAAAKKPAPKKQGKSTELPTVKAYNEYKSTVEQSGAQFKKIGPDEKIDLGGGAILTVIAPQPPLFTREQMKAGGNEMNANSIVMRLDYGEFSLLLAGDAEAQTEDRLTNKELNLAAKVLKVAHHGSKYASSENFLKRVQPEAAIISTSEFNRYGHPAPAVLERLKATGVRQLYRTDLQGEITITTTGNIKDGKLYEIKAAKETKSDLWAGREAQKDDSSRSGFVTYGDFGPPPRQRTTQKK